MEKCLINDNNYKIINLECKNSLEERQRLVGLHLGWFTNSIWARQIELVTLNTMFSLVITMKCASKRIPDINLCTMFLISIVALCISLLTPLVSIQPWHELKSPRERKGLEVTTRFEWCLVHTTKVSKERKRNNKY